MCSSDLALQFAVSQELLLLEVARQAIQQVKAMPAPAPADGNSSPLLVTKGEPRGTAQVRVRACTPRWHA